MNLLEHLKGFPAKTVIVNDGNKLVTSEHLLSNVLTWKTAFEKNQYTHCALFCENRVRFTEAMFGAWCAGVRTILPTDMTEFTRSQLANSYTAFIFDEDADSSLTAQANKGSIQDLRLDMDHPLVELFTSGSTGQPARIVKTLKQIFEGIERLDRNFPCPIDSQATVYSTVSHQHIYGFLWALLWPLASGRRISSTRLMFPETICDRLSKTPNSVLVSSPAHLRRLPQELDWKEAKANLSVIISSGGPLDEDGLRLTDRIFNVTPYEILGSTELDGIAWRQRLIKDNEIVENSTYWQAMPDTEVFAGPDNIICVKSARLGNDVIQGDDRIECLADGRFKLLGRVDRIVKIEEKRVSLNAMETHATDSGLLNQCKVFQIPETHQLALLAVPNNSGLNILRTQGKLALVRTLHKHLLQRFEPVMLPHRWRFEPMIPTDSRGKSSIATMFQVFRPEHIQPTDWCIGHNELMLRFSATTSCPFFKGHFSEFQLMPGVAQLHWAVTLANRYLNTPLQVAEVVQLKFSAIITPKAELCLTAQFNVPQNELIFSLTSPDKKIKFSSGKIRFRTTDTTLY